MAVVALLATHASAHAAEYPESDFAWSLQQSGVDDSLFDIAALDADHAWAVGADGAILSYDGAEWNVQPSGVGEAVESVSAVDAGHVWAVGEQGKILFYHGFGWSEQASSTSEHLLGIAAANASRAWACGYKGTIIEYDGADWSAMDSGEPDAVFRDISAADENHVWAVSDHGVIDFYNGDVWTSSQGPANHLESVFAPDSKTVWAAGWNGDIALGQAVGPLTTTRTWGHDSIGVPAPADTWYLAEGCTAFGFETWVLVQNPNPGAAHVDLTFMTPAGPVPGPSVNLPGNSRRTFDVADSVPDAKEVSTLVKANADVIAERAMYGNGRRWGHDSVGVTAAKKSWYLAEGCTADAFETWILVQNPGGEPARVTITYMTPAGAVAGPAVTLKPHTRRTFNASETVPGVWEVSTFISSDEPIVAERAMYGNGRTWGHDSIGASMPSASWFLAEGCTAQGFETWILVQNPNYSGVQVTLTYMTPFGDVPGPTAILSPNTRKSFNVADTIAGAWEVSTRVDANRPVIAERAMYGNERTWGHDSIGAPVPQTDWYLAEGSTGHGFETWILVQNPNGTPAEVEFTLMTDTGMAPGPVVTLQPDSRISFNVWETVGTRWEVSTAVHADKPVIAERAMYGDPKGDGGDGVTLKR